MFVATTTTDSQPSSGGDLNRRDAKSLARRSRNHKEDRQNHGRTESWGTKTESGLAGHNWRRRVEVGTPVARRPPHRSRRAVFPHRAPQANTRCIARRKVCQ